MGVITDKVNEFWSPLTLARAMDFQIEVLRREIQEMADQTRRGKTSLPPEPELQRGDFVSYISDGGGAGRKKGDKVWGIFHHNFEEQDCVWGYFQHPNGDFKKILGWIAKDQVTFEFRPEK